MASGSYEHPSFLTRQNLCLGRTIAGAGAAMNWSPQSAIVIHRFTASVVTAGTVVGTGVGAAGACVSLRNGTAIVAGTVALSTNAAGVFGTTTDLNYTVPVGGTLSVVNGTDATLVAYCNIEYNLDPSATW